MAARPGWLPTQQAPTGSTAAAAVCLLPPFVFFFFSRLLSNEPFGFFFFFSSPPCHHHISKKHLPPHTHHNLAHTEFLLFRRTQPLLGLAAARSWAHWPATHGVHVNPLVGIVCRRECNGCEESLSACIWSCNSSLQGYCVRCAVSSARGHPLPTLPDATPLIMHDFMQHCPGCLYGR
jgi:hypothetical protein